MRPRVVCFFNQALQLEKLLPAVLPQFHQGLFSKDKRKRIISCVYHVNRVIYDVTLTVGRDVSFWMWPTVDKVDPLRDERVTDVLCRESKEHCYVPWSIGQGGEEKHKLKKPGGIATNSIDQFIVADWEDEDVKVFDSSGKFMARFSIPTYLAPFAFFALDATTDMNDNIYVPVGCMKYCALIGNFTFNFVYKFTYTGDLQHKFPLRKGVWFQKCMAITNSDKVFGTAVK